MNGSEDPLPLTKSASVRLQMKTQESTTAGTNIGIDDIWPLINSGELPEYLYESWRQSTGLDPRRAQKIFSFRKEVEMVLFVIILGVLALVINKLVAILTGKPGLEWVNMWYCSGTLILGIPLLFSLTYWGPDWEDKYVGAFERAIYWIVTLRPSGTKQFPPDKGRLGILLDLLMTDMAKLVGRLQIKGQRHAACIAKNHLICLHRAAIGLRVVQDSSEGLGPWFKQANKQRGYSFLNVRDWVNRYNRTAEQRVVYEEIEG